MKTWFKVSENSDFTIYNIPFGIFSTSISGKRVGIAIGDSILDLVIAYDLGIFKSLDFSKSVLEANYLNDFISLGKSITNKVRTIIQDELCDKNSNLKSSKEAFIFQKEAVMHLPVKVGDYTDFYSSIEHATNVGTMFRDPDNALLPNWKHIPVGYHGRASSIMVSGKNIHRPKGQVLKPNETFTFNANSSVPFSTNFSIQSYYFDDSLIYNSYTFNNYFIDSILVPTNEIGTHQIKGSKYFGRVYR